MIPRGFRSWNLAAGGALLVGLAAGCARQGSPPGGERDVLPPVVVATRPDTFQSLDVVDDPIRIQFNERISERPSSGSLDDAVLVSPRTGDVRVDHKRDALEVDLSGGVRPGLVYRVTVLPVIQDMFSNPMQRPFEFVFSTGGTFERTAVAGLVLDRLTAEPYPNARVIARRIGGDTSVVYTAGTDTSGIYALRYLPPGPYELVAFEDRNADFRPGPTEIQGRREIELADTVLSDLVVLEPDTSAARLATVEPRDSAVLTVAFDDYLDPGLDPEGDLRVILDVDSTTPGDAPRPPDVVRTFHPWAWEARLDSLRAARDTTPPDPDEAEEPEEPEDAGRLIPGPLPSRELRVLMDRALPVGVPYSLRVEGVLNLAGIPGGGGTRRVMREEPVGGPARDSTVADSTRAVEDTTGVPPDTGAVAPPDTTVASPPDTSVVPDTTVVSPPDTSVVPDTTVVSPPDTSGTPDTTVVSPPDTSAAPDTTGAGGPPGGSRGPRPPPPDLPAAAHPAEAPDPPPARPPR